MKPLAVSLAVLAAILAFSLWTGCYVRGRTEAWSDQLAATDELAQQERWEDAEAGLQRAYADWDAIQTFLHTLMEHDALDEAEPCLPPPLPPATSRTGRIFTRP